MVGPPFDCLANPLGAVRLTFDKAISSGFDPSTSTGNDWGAVDLFNQFLFENGGLSEVPILNRTNANYLQTNTLVRFRGMIQDMLGNEFYVGAYKDGSSWRTNKFTDPQCQMAMSPDVKLWERQLLYCVPVPGLNCWTQTSGATIRHCINSSLEQGEKRQREDDEADDHMELVQGQDGNGSPSSKKMREDGMPSTSNLQESQNEKSCTAMSWVSNPDRDPLPCLVKVYNNLDSAFKLHEVFEFIGVFSFDQEQSSVKDGSDEVVDGLSEDELTSLPSCKVPQLHCIVHRKLGVHDFLLGSPMVDPNPMLIGGIRDGLLSHLTAVLGNDRIAAQFLLLHLLSRVHTRVDTVAVGKLSLNFTCLSKESSPIFGSRLNFALKDLLPFSQCIPLTVEYLNCASLATKKDYQTNRLVCGVLQVADGSHLTFNETLLVPGTLNSKGVENTRLLKKFIQLQQVEYDFEYYKMEMSTDVQLLVLSEGKSNILPADVAIPFQPCSTSSLDVVDTETLQAWRWYLATLRSLPHSLTPEIQKVIEEDLVAARLADRSLAAEDLSRLLTMGRLMAISFGETSMSLEHWQMVKELERLRKGRLKLLFDYEIFWGNWEILSWITGSSTKNMLHNIHDHRAAAAARED
ncbi:hypothetical protein V2J09_017592 [Rumex salicifolius]